MALINGVSGNSPIQKIVTQPVHKQVPAAAPPQVRVSDRLELSGVGHIVQALKTNDIRADLVSRVKAEIKADAYDADGKKLDRAIDALLGDMLS